MKMKGSLTVEVSLLLPLILVTFVILIYLSFYLHDQAVLTSCAYEAAISGNKQQSQEEINLSVEEKVKQLINNRLLGTTNVKSQISVDKKMIKVIFNGRFKVPGMQLLYSLIPLDELSVMAEVSIHITSPVEFIRNCRMIEQIKDKIEE